MYQLENDRSLYPSFLKDPSYRQLLEELDIISENSDLSSLTEQSSSKSTNRYAKLVIAVEMLGVGSKAQDQNLFAVYNVRVQYVDEKGEVTRAWNVIRRYSDFYKLNITIQQKVRDTLIF